MRFSGILRKLGSNHIWRHFWFLHWKKLDLQPLTALLNFSCQVCKLCILKTSRYTNIDYIAKYLVLTYIERFISTVCCFLRYICWSVNCMSWVSKFNNFFLTCTETEARFIFEGFNIALYEKFISDSPILFLLFFYLVCILFEGLFRSLCQSVNYMSWVSKFNNFFLTCREADASFIYEGFHIALYAKFISNSPILFLLFLSGM